MTNGERIKVLRQYYGISMRELGKRCGVGAKQYIHQIENGYPMSEKLQKAMIKAFSLPADFFTSDVHLELVVNQVENSTMTDKERLEVLMRYKDMSQERFAHTVGFSHVTVNKFIKQVYPLSERFKLSTIKAFNLPKDFFISDIKINMIIKKEAV